ncbi:hypothetical protein EDWATA_02252 [Edwardsiella tarda ATCC 23685]|uniref:Uncharacterized protein n=1 Tax=Edwardsiella tarda ATCC 23685 TaxID=500638 RepID=D4F671_EDWTA|nr:hypothetical protein EDWATA_02252 [Edwardsiella tarda ATCC 23685]BEH72305.1 hypothetical protein GBS0709_14220 [Edwardsiella tarda]GAC63780.1 hypothetical protein ET1_07_00090 [Edwardsiella tarda ATCC 15947 = NBRC 105688]
MYCVVLGLWRFFVLVAVDFPAEENRVGTTLMQFVDHLLALAVCGVYIFCDGQSITGIMATWADQQNKSD